MVLKLNSITDGDTIEEYLDTVTVGAITDNDIVRSFDIVKL
jgi:hypothetical protein